MSLLENCKLCPRACGADRTKTRGVCGAGACIEAARASLHLWEEPVIYFSHTARLAAYSARIVPSAAERPQAE